MFEAAVDGFGRAVAGVGVVEVGQDVPGSVCVLPSVMSSVRPLGTRVEVRDRAVALAATLGALGARVEVSVLISACIRDLPRILLGSR